MEKKKIDPLFVVLNTWSAMGDVATNGRKGGRPKLHGCLGVFSYRGDAEKASVKFGKRLDVSLLEKICTEAEFYPIRKMRILAVV